MSDEEAIREFVRSLFGTDHEPEPETGTSTTSVPVIDGQANTPEPRTMQETNRALATTPSGWLGALFNNNPQL